MVADRYNKLITIFHADGQFLGTISEEGSFSLPFHCVQYEKYLIVKKKKSHWRGEEEFSSRWGQIGLDEAIAWTLQEEFYSCNSKEVIDVSSSLESQAAITPNGNYVLTNI